MSPVFGDREPMPDLARVWGTGRLGLDVQVKERIRETF